MTVIQSNSLNSATNSIQRSVKPTESTQPSPTQSLAEDKVSFSLDARQLSSAQNSADEMSNKTGAAILVNTEVGGRGSVPPTIEADLGGRGSVPPTVESELGGRGSVPPNV